MASDKSFLDFVLGQIETIGDVTFRKMFGEYAIYLNKKVVGLICDNQLYIKPTEKTKDFVADITMGAPYPNAKLHYLIEDQIDDSDWLCELIKLTESDLPEPKPKKGKKSEKFE